MHAYTSCISYLLSIGLVRVPVVQNTGAVPFFNSCFSIHVFLRNTTAGRKRRTHPHNKKAPTRHKKKLRPIHHVQNASKTQYDDRNVLELFEFHQLRAMTKKKTPFGEFSSSSGNLENSRDDPYRAQTEHTRCSLYQLNIVDTRDSDHAEGRDNEVSRIDFSCGSLTCCTA